MGPSEHCNALQGGRRKQPGDAGRSSLPGGARARGGAAVAGLPGDDAGLVAAVGVLVEGAIVLDGAALTEVVPNDLDGARLDLDLSEDGALVGGLFALVRGAVLAVLVEHVNVGEGGDEVRHATHLGRLDVEVEDARAAVTGASSTRAARETGGDADEKGGTEEAPDVTCYRFTHLEL